MVLQRLLSQRAVYVRNIQRQIYLNQFSRYSFSTDNGSFFASSSIRSQRRKRRLVLQEKRANSKTLIDEATGDPKIDTRTVKDILFPTPDYGDDEFEDRKQYPKTLSEWRNGFQQGWRVYLSTWHGFLSSNGFIVEEKKPENHDWKNDAHNKGNELKENVKHNFEFIAQESKALQEKATEVTGISTKEDLRRVAADMMRLASLCVNEFMSGYRKGRDDEVEKMLTHYFQELEDEANKPIQRKVKRRVIGRPRHLFI